MQTTMPSFITEQIQPCFPPSHEYQCRPNNRRPSASAMSTRSSKSMKDRRRSSGALSTHSQQKPKKCIGEYVVGKTLGKGASGRVKLGVHRHTGEQVAIKIISKAHLAANPAIEKAVRREIAIMKLIHHPNVMSLIDVIDDPSSSDLYLILEYVEGGELFEYLVSKGRLSESEARHHFQQIILGLDYCHHHLICHRDLKPENLLLNSKNSIKIADFGMASLQPLGSMLETSCGSPHYASPEIVAGMPYHGSSCDIWSCGVILYALLTGHLPFDDENIRNLLKKVKSGKYVMPDNISRSAQDLIRRILVVDPSKRLNMQQIMSHTWFRQVEPDNIAILPVPPTEKEIGQPVADASEIDDRILETIKFLWGERSDQVVIDALIQKEHNMQKVVYVLLQQHAERYWQADHAEESDDDDSYTDTPQRRYRTIGRRSVRDKKYISATESHTSEYSPKPTYHNRPTVPWIPDNKHKVSRRQSAATISTERPAIIDPPPTPPLPSHVKSEKIKKSETFYTKFVKNVLSPRRQATTRDEPIVKEAPQTPTPTSKPIAATIAGTFRRKNPFQRAPINTTDFEISTSPKPTTTTTTAATHRFTNSTVLHRNKIDPSLMEDQPKKYVTLNSKKLSLHIPNAFKSNDGTKKFGFTLGSTRKQRKQLDLSIFQQDPSNLQPPPALLSDESTLSSSSISTCSSSTHGSCYQVLSKTACKTNNTNKHSAQMLLQRRSSQTSFKSVDRRGSNVSTCTLGGHPRTSHSNRPITPSLLSNSSTITSPPMTPTATITPTQQPPKASWLQNLFFFKQPKVCSLVVYSTDTVGILKTLHRLMNLTAEARFYEKCDRLGVARYKAEIRTKATQGGKIRQVKCRIELIMSDLDSSSCVVQFTQQQGDGVLLNLTIQQLQDAVLKEYPYDLILASESYKEITGSHEDNNM